jgi:hypothetical protein
MDPTLRPSGLKCQQLGGPCAFEHRGATADEIIKAQDHHLKATVVVGDESHQAALGDMKARWRYPIAAMRWYKQAKSDFAALVDA